MPAEGTFRDGREAGFHLIETMRWEPGSGLVRERLHMARLKSSAAALGIPFDAGVIGAPLAALHAETALRVRIGLYDDGSTTLETWPFVPLTEGVVWKLKIASTRLNSAEPLLRHKTSRRGVYEAARAEFPSGAAQEVLLLNERGELCEGTITTIFARLDDGGLVTPPLTSGLLAGVLRAQLLASGEASERVLNLHDLLRTRELFVGNSLRGLIRATLA